MNTRAASERRGKTALIVLLAVFALLAVAVFWVWRKPPTQPDLDEGRAVAERFLDLVRKGQAGAAWDSTTAEFKSAEGRESFVARVKQQPALVSPLNFVAVQTVTIDQSPRAEYSYRPADAKTTVRLLAGNENGTWRIDRMQVE